MADFMKGGGMEHGVLWPKLTEKTIFKLIWVQCCLFVLWLPKEKGNTIYGPPATNCTYPQTV